MSDRVIHFYAFSKSTVFVGIGLLYSAALNVAEVIVHISQNTRSCTRGNYVTLLLISNIRDVLFLRIINSKQSVLANYHNMLYRVNKKK